MEPLVLSIPPKPIGELLECAVDLIKMAKLFGYKNEDSTLAQRISLQWTNLLKDTSISWFSFIKYKTASFYSSCTNQALPPLPVGLENDRPDLICGTGLGRWFRQQCRETILLEDSEKENKRLILLTTIKNGLKRGLPKPNKKDLLKAEIKTYKVLTSEPMDIPKPKSFLGDWNEVDKLHKRIQFTIGRITAEIEIRRTVQELFQGHHFTKEDRMKTFFPSTSANYLRTRKNMGMVGYILDKYSHLRKPGGYLKLSREIKREYKDDDKIHSIEPHIPTIDDIPSWVMDTTELEEVTETLWFNLLRDAVGENKKDFQNKVQLVALAEPLKTRTISKGPPATYYVLRNMWKFVHNRLRQHKTFRLIGEPINWEIVQETIGKKP
jgi:hypothetical protein